MKANLEAAELKRTRADEHFRIWMKQVDAWLHSNAGVTHEDMTDFNYRDAFDRGCDSVSTARCAYFQALEDY